MKKIRLILILSFSFAIDPLLLIGVSNDKAMHGAGGYIITDVSETKYKLEWWESGLLNYGLGVLKEQIDVWCGGKWDNNDIKAQMTGWASYRFIHFEFNF